MKHVNFKVDDFSLTASINWGKCDGAAKIRRRRHYDFDIDVMEIRRSSSTKFYGAGVNYRIERNEDRRTYVLKQAVHSAGQHTLLLWSYWGIIQPVYIGLYAPSNKLGTRVPLSTEVDAYGYAAKSYTGVVRAHAAPRVQLSITDGHIMRCLCHSAATFVTVKHRPITNHLRGAGDNIQNTCLLFISARTVRTARPNRPPKLGVPQSEK